MGSGVYDDRREDMQEDQRRAISEFVEQGDVELQEGPDPLSSLSHATLRDSRVVLVLVFDWDDRFVGLFLLHYYAANNLRGRR